MFNIYIYSDMDNSSWIDTTISCLGYSGLNVSSAPTRIHEDKFAASPRRVFEAVVVMTIAILALTGNTCLWIVIVAKRFKLRKTSNALILCLSGADMLVSSVTMPMISYTLLVGEWRFSHELCILSGFLTMLTFVASVMSLSVISINRYFIVCHPYDVSTRYTPRKTAIWIAGVWMLSGTLATPPLLGWSEYSYDHDQSFCFAHWACSVSYTFFMVGVCFGGPCTSMSVCYFKIFKEIQSIKRALVVDEHGSMAGCVRNTAAMSVATAQRGVRNSHATGHVSRPSAVKSIGNVRCSKRTKSAENAGNALINARAERNNDDDECTEQASSHIENKAESKRIVNGLTENAYMTGNEKQSHTQIKNSTENVNACNDTDLNAVQMNSEGKDPSKEENHARRINQSRGYVKHTIPYHVQNAPLHVIHKDFKMACNCKCDTILADNSSNNYATDLSNQSNEFAKQNGRDVLTEMCNVVYDARQSHLDNCVVESSFSDQQHCTMETCLAVVNDATPVKRVPGRCHLNNSNGIEGDVGRHIKDNDDFVSSLRDSSTVVLAMEDKQTCKKDKATHTAPRLHFGKTKSSFRLYQKEEIQLTISFLIAIIFFIICWFPFCITMFCSVFFPGYVPRGVNLLTSILGCLNSSINPIIYFSLNNRFSKAFRALFTLQMCKPSKK